MKRKSKILSWWKKENRGMGTVEMILIIVDILTI